MFWQCYDRHKINYTQTVLTEDGLNKTDTAYQFAVFSDILVVFLPLKVLSGKPKYKNNKKERDLKMPNLSTSSEHEIFVKDYLWNSRNL